MAGGFKGSFDPKKPNLGQISQSEVLKEDSGIQPVDKKPATFSLRGILGLGQTVELGKPQSSFKESFLGLSHLAQEQNVLFDKRQQEIKKAIEDLRTEITKLIHQSDNLNKDVQKIAVEEIIDASEYQLSFLNRIRVFLAGVSKNIGEASLWVEAFAAKKKKRNYFWNTAKNKKKGGDQFMFSSEHSVARSVN